MAWQRHIHNPQKIIMPLYMQIYLYVKFRLAGARAFSALVRASAESKYEVLPLLTEKVSRMKTILSLMISGALALCALQPGHAQTPASKAPAATTTPDAASDSAKRAKAKACSDQADAKGLHGKARHAFRAKCKRG
jgi:hypothetical protein